MRTIDFDIQPISNTPKLEVIKQKISQLLVGDDKAALPVFVNSVDSGETLDAKIVIKNAPSDWIGSNGSISSPLSFYLSYSFGNKSYHYIALGLFYTTFIYSLINFFF